MRSSFCKKSVFCIQFLFMFFLGTISGVLLLRGLLLSDSCWLFAYCKSLQAASLRPLYLHLWFSLVPFLSAVMIAFTRISDKLFPVLFFLRGCICSYTAGAYYSLGIPMTNILVANLFLLPLFYAVCQQLSILCTK